MQQIPTNPSGGNELLYPDLSYEIVGCCYDTHNELGPFAKEKQYGDLLENKLREKNIAYKREIQIGDTGNTVDFIIEGKFLLELKAKRFLLKEDYLQTQRYLQASGVKLGILVNFRGTFARTHRVVRIDNPGRKPPAAHS